MIEGKTRAEVKQVCRGCHSNLCEGLYWKDIIVSPDFSAVPFDCPLRTDDEYTITSELHRLSEYEVSRISADVWVKHNYTSRYVYTANHKVEEIEYILNHLRQNKCSIICKSANPWYEPWKLFGFWAKCGGRFDFQKKGEEKEEKFATNTLADETPPSHFPMRITGIRWSHADLERRKESPDSVVEGDTIALEADFENYVEGAGVDFYLYCKANGNEKKVEKLHSRCQGMKANVEWKVSLADCDADDPDWQFDCEARDKSSDRAKIHVRPITEFYSSF